MRGLKRMKLVVPRDMALVGFDDFEWADCFEPQLTVIAQPCEEIGRSAAKMLLERINRTGTTVLMATHNQEIVNAMRRRVLALEHGTLVRDESGAAYEREY